MGQPYATRKIYYVLQNLKGQYLQEGDVSVESPKFGPIEKAVMVTRERADFLLREWRVKRNEVLKEELVGSVH